MTRCPARPRSATKARRTTRVFARNTARGASNSSSTAAANTAADRSRSAFRRVRRFEASRAVAHRHGLAEAATVFAQQNPDVIDAGVFHNDVIAVGNRNTLFCHQLAFVEQNAVYDELRTKLGGLKADVQRDRSAGREVSVADAVDVVSVQQPVADAPGRQAGAGRAAGMPRERARRRSIWTTGLAQRRRSTTCSCSICAKA